MKKLNCRFLVSCFSMLLLGGIITSVNGQVINNDSLTIEYFDSVYYHNTFSLDDDKFEVGQIFQVEPAIIFEYNRYKIHKMSTRILDSLAQFLIDHPRLKIEIARHKDGRGSKYYSRLFTHRRAKEIHQQLIFLGVDSAQLTHRGYEHSHPVVPWEAITKYIKSKGYQELAHQKNRRTELRILATDFKKQVINSTDGKIHISGNLTCDNTDLPVGNGSVLYKNSKGFFAEVKTDSLGHYEFYCDPEMTSIQATSNDTIANQFGTVLRKYFSADKVFIDLTVYPQDTIINFSIPLVTYCGLHLRVNFKNNSTKSENFDEQIKSIIMAMKDNPAISKLEIRGYTASDENIKLQKKRAKKVLKAFLKGGFSISNVSVNLDHSNEPVKHLSYGCDGKHKIEPVNSLLNARVDFIILEIE